MSKKALSPELQDQLDTLAALPENEIDTVDIPEAPPEAWLHARRPGLYRPVKKPVTLRLDADVVAWFKEHAQDHGYQTEINRVLRRYVSDAQA
ncbi:BrnA antitoxin family protein [Sphingomonas sp. UYP23]